MTRGLHWFRNDLRLQDNTALAALAERAEEWLPVFVLDPRLRGDASGGGPRMRFLLDCLARLGRALEKRGVPLLVSENGSSRAPVAKAPPRHRRTPPQLQRGHHALRAPSR